MSCAFATLDIGSTNDTSKISTSNNTKIQLISKRLVGGIKKYVYDVKTYYVKSVGVLPKQLYFPGNIAASEPAGT